MPTRNGMGLVGPGFVGVHHIDAVRRLGFVDVVAIAASTEKSARAKADALGVPKAYGSYEQLIADPDVHVVHNTTPNFLHVPVIKAALARRKHVVSDIGSHWCDLVQHVAGQRIVEVLADLTTVIGTRMKPAGSVEAFAKGAGDRREPFTMQSEDLATLLVRFDGGAKGAVNVGQVCAGHKNDLWFEINGARASLGWRQERQNELWIGRRESASGILPKDPSLLMPGARKYAHLPGGHQEAWADAFCNVMRDIYAFIADGRTMSDLRPPAFATFEDGYHAACIVDAVLESHRRGG